MPRFAKNNQTIRDLKNKIKSYENGVYEILNDNVAPKVVKDLSKIDVSFENAGLIDDFDMTGMEDVEPYEMIGDFPIAWCGCGGDWQYPLVFVLYIGDEGKLRAYIPSKGNAYDHKNKCAYGGDGEDEDEYAEGTFDYIFDINEMREDIKNRIQVKDNSNVDLYDEETLKKLEGYVWNDEEEQDQDYWIGSEIFYKFLMYVSNKFSISHDIVETMGCEDYDDTYTFDGTDDWMYIIFGKGSKSEDMPLYLLIHNKNQEAVINEEFDDAREFAEYLDREKDKLGKILQRISNSFDK